MMAMAHASKVSEPWEVVISADRTPEKAWADWLTSRLEPRGVGVHRVPSDDDALQFVRRGHLMLAVLDTSVRHSECLGLLRRIRSITNTLPCLLVADAIDERFLKTALELRAYSVISTPVDERILRDLIAAVFRRVYESDLVL